MVKTRVQHDARDRPPSLSGRRASDRKRYLRATLKAIAAGYPNADLDDLLPWVFPKTAVKAAA